MEDFSAASWPDVPNWSENYALSGYDRKTGVDVFLALGRWRQDLSLWREMITIALPDQTVLAHRAVGNARARGKNPGGPNLALEILEDGRRQRWSFLGGMRRVPAERLKRDLLDQGPLQRAEFAFEFESECPLWDLGEAGKASAVAGHAHIEQIGRTLAEIRVGSEVFGFDSEINRDHSRGPRLVGAVTRHAWLHAIFENGLRVQAYEMFEGSETRTPRFSKAAIIKDGALFPAVMTFGPALPDVRPIERIFDPLQLSFDWAHPRLDMTIVRFPTTVHVQPTAPWNNYIGARQVGSAASLRLVEQSALYEMADGTRGYGHIERTVPGAILSDEQLC
ncbi:MAG TPA: hypothetical protein VJQ47_13260 [Steroidobacteraceae bacterium]|nr:hypothetical protein [Steroidobacteraceae bacterium]